METVELGLRTGKAVRQVILAAFPGYRKHRAFVSTFPKGGVQVNSFWDGGSRSEFALVDLKAMKAYPVPRDIGHPYFEVLRRGVANQADEILSADHVGNVTLLVLPPGFALVKGGVFCGKTATAHVYTSGVNLLGEAREEVGSA